MILSAKSALFSMISSYVTMTPDWRENSFSVGLSFSQFR